MWVGTRYSYFLFGSCDCANLTLIYYSAVGTTDRVGITDDDFKVHLEAEIDRDIIIILRPRRL